MRTRSLFPALSLLALATSSALAQQVPTPRRSLKPFRSDAELVQFLAGLDRQRPRQTVASVSCTGTAGVEQSKKHHLITGRVQGSNGTPVANAFVSGIGICTQTASDGRYRLLIPRDRSSGDTATVIVRAIGYRSQAKTVTLRRRTKVDFVLEENPLQLGEMVVAGAVSAFDAVPTNESITNTQHAGVDEGGIVKLHGDYLVVLRRGRLFTISVRDAELRPVSMIDAFPPGGRPAEWYDEMLIERDRVIVIGYSYMRGGTEVGLFALDRDGGLRHLSTSHLRSWDYYSSRNYASRLVGGKLIYYSALPLRLGTDPLAQLPAIREWRPDPDSSGFERIVTPRRVYRPARSLSGSEYLTLHTITQCDVRGSRLECEASVVIGPYSRVFYVSPSSVYVWTADWPWRNKRPARQPGMLFRLPLDGSAPGALAVAGSPVDQFSFLEDEEGHLNVVVQPDAAGDAMWTAEWSGHQGQATMALLRIPLADLNEGRDQAPRSWYRPIPAPGAGTFHNRFVGDHLLYGAGNGWWYPTTDSAIAFIVPWRGGEVTRLGLPHGVDRIEVMGNDAVIIGGSGDDLHFSGVRLGARPVLLQRFVMEHASQGELRSHGFFYRPEDARSGMLGLPLRGGTESGYEHLFEGSASVLFLRNAGRQFSTLGTLAASAQPKANDNCKASCVDWYGNARPLFLRSRIFALLGYELVEGALEADGIREIRRADFTPLEPVRAVGN
jgi:hypothetical protein